MCARTSNLQRSPRVVYEHAPRAVFLAAQDVGALASHGNRSAVRLGAFKRPLRASLTSSVSILMGGVLQNPHRGLSCLVFDLLPNPSIDDLVVVVLLEYDGCPGDDGAQATRGIVV
jgi:hypothetical protein